MISSIKHLLANLPHTHTPKSTQWSPVQSLHLLPTNTPQTMRIGVYTPALLVLALLPPVIPTPVNPHYIQTFAILPRKKM
jgi:hypothetical protein